jgi:hypothetical protein
MAYTRRTHHAPHIHQGFVAATYAGIFSTPKSSEFFKPGAELYGQPISIHEKDYGIIGHQNQVIKACREAITENRQYKLHATQTKPIEKENHLTIKIVLTENFQLSATSHIQKNLHHIVPDPTSLLADTTAEVLMEAKDELMPALIYYQASTHRKQKFDCPHYIKQVKKVLNCTLHKKIRFDFKTQISPSFEKNHLVYDTGKTEINAQAEILHILAYYHHSKKLPPNGSLTWERELMLKKISAEPVSRARRRSLGAKEIVTSLCGM